MLRDTIPSFELYQPADLETALDLLNRFGANRCVPVTPSDTLPALVALDAAMVIRSRMGERVVKAEDFFMTPLSVDIMRMTVLEPGDILTAIRISDTWAAARFYFEQVVDRQHMGLCPGERSGGPLGRWGRH